MLEYSHRLYNTEAKANEDQKSDVPGLVGGSAFTLLVRRFGVRIGAANSCKLQGQRRNRHGKFGGGSRREFLWHNHARRTIGLWLHLSCHSLRPSDDSDLGPGESRRRPGGWERRLALRHE